ncbi:helix-turn-helix transcriptional regulator [Streptomyces sp. NPDC006662]|uniref:helix-turn-helix transcriptional regulator n=1 Tax=Streptomyces sp. NPDC006662 TaxID=3156902 RepID=UPI0033EC5A49
MSVPDLEDTGCCSGASLCDRGVEYYLGAVRAGNADPATIPSCVLRLQLVQPVTGSAHALTPIRPSSALALLVRPIEQEISARQQAAQDLQHALEPIEALYNAHQRPVSDLTVLEGLATINAAIDHATVNCSKELLTAQPGGGRSSSVLTEALRRSKELLDRGVQVRTLYQHTVRYNPATMAYVREITAHSGGAEVRTLDELFERLIIFDRSVAYLPARGDRRNAVEVRQPALVAFLVDIYERAWDRATPLVAAASAKENPSVIPGVRRSIAQLLVAGYVDEAIARRLGMSVRTCRAHIAKIAEQLGSTNRAQLGYLLGASGFLDEPDVTAPE